MATNSNDVKLIGGWASSYCIRVQIALNLKGVFEYEYIKETFNPKSDLLIDSNPIYKKIPVLLHGDKIICESLIIVQYIDEVWRSSETPNILPSDPHDRAMAHFWAYYVDDILTKATGVAVKSVHVEDKLAACDEIGKILVVLEDAFVKCSKGKEFFGGDSIGFVDITLGSCWGWLKVIESINKVMILDESKIPNLLKWSDRFCSDGVVKDVVPQNEKLLDFAVNVLIPMSTQIPPS